jgi:thiol-disulfide isomerase/thioredoxin
MENIQTAKQLLNETVFNLTVQKNTIKVIKKGHKFNFQNHENKIILLDFFATWCSACRAVAPHLGNLQQKYPEKLLVLGVLLEENKSNDSIELFKSKYKANYQVSNSYDNFKLSNSIAQTLRLPRSFPIPLLVMLKNGEYFTHYVGAVPEEMIESDIKDALGLRK